MITRIVKMTFAPNEVQNFLNIFYENKNKIAGFEGCTHLELLNDINSSNIFFTYSYWKDETYLEAYRNSELFKGVWQRTKKLFTAKPEAWSVKKM
jgi:quinol monooxygenase YgiN